MARPSGRAGSGPIEEEWVDHLMSRRTARELLVVARELTARRAPKGKYLVELAAVPNLDYTGDVWEAKVRIRPKFVAVRSLKDAPGVVRAFIRGHRLGGGNWAGGEIFDDGGNLVGHVSYNGRIWEGPKGKWPSKEIKAAVGFDARKARRDVGRALDNAWKIVNSHRIDAMTEDDPEAEDKEEVLGRIEEFVDRAQELLREL